MYRNHTTSIRGKCSGSIPSKGKRSVSIPQEGKRSGSIAVFAPAYNEENLIGLGMSFIPVIETMPEYVDRIALVLHGQVQGGG